MTNGFIGVSRPELQSTQECPIHLSAGGYVLEPIPDGTIKSR
ncbi:MAG: hypothetical protein QOJ40_264 [Verrucomicrobiota bacterium]